jgi:hypothetical protein
MQCICSVLEAELLEELPCQPSPPAEVARRSSTLGPELELLRPEALDMRSAYNLVRKALLPKVKYHWDQGFKQVKCYFLK